MTIQLTVFFDGFCPLCVKEMTALAERDTNGLLHLVDIQSDSFKRRYPQIDKVDASRVLHAIDYTGATLLGLDVTYRAWQLLGRGWCFAWLRWPVIKPIADICYRIFARHRYSISYMLTGRRRCQTGLCDLATKDSKHRVHHIKVKK